MLSDADIKLNFLEVCVCWGRSGGGGGHRGEKLHICYPMFIIPAINIGQHKKYLSANKNKKRKCKGSTSS